MKGKIRSLAELNLVDTVVQEIGTGKILVITNIDDQATELLDANGKKWAWPRACRVKLISEPEIMPV